MDNSTEDRCEWIDEFIRENHLCWQTITTHNPDCPQCNGRGDYPLDAGLHTQRNCELCTTDKSIEDAMRYLLRTQVELGLPSDTILDLDGCWGWKDLWMKLAENDNFYGKDKIFLRACIIMCRFKDKHCQRKGKNVLEAKTFPVWVGAHTPIVMSATEVWESYFNVDCFAIEEAIKIFGTSEDIQELDLEASGYDADTQAQIYRVLRWMHN